jgi:O-antigen/teichoic acid export membrane protein
MRIEIFWNIAALGVIAIAGLMLNFAIGRLYDPAALGIFNQVLAVFLILGQLAVGGFFF